MLAKRHAPEGSWQVLLVFPLLCKWHINFPLGENFNLPLSGITSKQGRDKGRCTHTFYELTVIPEDQLQQ